MTPTTKAAKAEAEADSITVRDHFAGQALIGLLSYGGPDRSDKDALAVAVYEFADAMMAARKTGKGKS